MREQPLNLSEVWLCHPQRACHLPQPAIPSNRGVCGRGGLWKGYVCRSGCLSAGLSVCVSVINITPHQRCHSGCNHVTVKVTPPSTLPPIKVTPHQCCNTCCNSLTVALQKSNCCMCKSLSNDAPTRVGATLAVQKSNFCMCNSQTFACAKVATVACAKVCCCTATVGATP